MKDLINGGAKPHRPVKLIQKILPAHFSVIKVLSLFAIFLFKTLLSITKGKILLTSNLVAFASFYLAEFIIVTALTMIATRESVLGILQNRRVRIYNIFALHFAAWTIITLFFLILINLTINAGRLDYLLQMDNNLLLAIFVQISALYFHLALYHYGKNLENDLFNRL